MAKPTDADSLKILFATAEYAPWVKVGGLAEASAGLINGLTNLGAEVEVVMPDYGLILLDDPETTELAGLPSWCGPIIARTGSAPTAGGVQLTVLSFDGCHRAHPYVDPDNGESWPDSIQFFMTYSAGLAALSAERRPDILHVNDWHSATALALVESDLPTVLTIHNLAYQGLAGPEWAGRFDSGDHFNPLATGINIADQVVLVSKSYTSEALSETGGFGLHQKLAAKGEALSGIRNGIDMGLWNPADDPWLPVNFDHRDLAGKEVCRKELLRTVGLEEDRGPVVGMVARLVYQKGIDLALDLVPYLESISARMILMGSGQPALAARANEVASRFPHRFHAITDYDEALAHLTVAGSDIFLMPSRFEPCGLTQMQAMTCGTIPVVSGVGGLRDTVVDTDRNPRTGTGFVANRPTSLDLLDAMHRATRGWTNSRRRAAVQRRGMTSDWSWAKPAKRYYQLYQHLCR